MVTNTLDPQKTITRLRFIEEMIQKTDAETNLLDFIKLTWPIVEPSRKFVYGWHIEAICDHLQAVTDGRITRLLINVPPGFTKALDCDTPVMTTWGWKTHGDLRPGDFVFGPDGEPKRVLDCTPHNEEIAYEVEFDDGAVLVAGEEHLWAVERDLPYGGPGATRCREARVVKTPDLVPSVVGRALQRPDRIPVASPLKMAPRRFLIDPYLLGVWLGDGATGQGVVYSAEQDIAHFAQLGRIAHTNPGTEGRQDFHRIAVEGFHVKLRILGLLDDKHIPDDYLEASVDQRWELLRGLMDTDGCATANGHCTYVTKLSRLGKQILSLACSLGIKAHLTETWSSIDGVRYGPYQNITFTAPADATIFKLERKQARVRPAQNARARYRYIKAVSPVGTRIVNCITVEGALYLAGERFVTTHNSLTTEVFWPAWEWGPRNMPATRYVSFSYNEGLTVRDNLRFSRIVESSIYQKFWGDRFSKDPKQWGKEKLQNDKTGFKYATSVSGVGTGERGDRVIIDDPHNVVEGESELVRLSTAMWFSESIPTRMNEPEHSAIVIIMQRVHEDDVSGIAIAKKLGYEHLMLPMEYDPRRHCSTSIGFEDPRRYDAKTGEELREEDCLGALLDPVRFPRPVVENLKIALGEYATAGQLQQSPAPRGGGLIKSDWWRPFPEEPEEFDPKGRPLKKLEFPPMEYILASLDTAYTTKQENDWSAMTIWGVWHDVTGLSRLMLMDAWQVRLGFRNLVEKVIETCRKRRIDSLLIEAKAAGLPVAQEIARMCNAGEWTVLPVNPKHDKVARVYAIQPFFEGGIVYAPDRKWAQLVIDECAKFPKGSHDDLVDSMSQALLYMRRAGLVLHSAESVEVNAQANLYESASEPLYDV